MLDAQVAAISKVDNERMKRRSLMEIADLLYRHVVILVPRKDLLKLHLSAPAP